MAKKAAKKAVKQKTKKPVTTSGKLFITRDPRVYEQSLPRIITPHKRAAGIDLGTKTGIAFCDFVPGHLIHGAPIIMGQWDLSLGTYDSGPLRHIRLKQFLSVLQPDLIVYEEVKYTPPQEMMSKKGMGVAGIVARVANAAEFLGGLKVTLSTWAEENGVPVEAVGIRAIKKWATGSGRANKVEMIEACNKRLGTAFETADYEKTGVDNICDAAFVCAMGVEAYSKGL